MNAELLLKVQHTYALGAMGEFIAKQFLSSFGYLVQATQNKKSGDLTVTDDNGEQFQIEVKTARQSEKGRFHFQLFKCDEHGSTNHLNSDFCLLLAVTKATIYYYLIPTKKLRKQSHIAITSHPTKYRGRLAQYRHKSSQLHLSSVG